jgi:hypothetical protein
VTENNQRPQLEYARESPWHRRRSARLVVLLCFGLLVLSATARWGNQMLMRIKAKYYFNQSMAWTAPSDYVAYQRHTQGWMPDGTVAVPWQNFYQNYTGSLPVSVGTLFLHERTSRGGNRRLVAVDVVGAEPHLGRVHANMRVFSPPVGIAWPKQRTTSIATLPLATNDGLFKIFAGQPDPNDPSHFTIVYEGGNHRGVIDGWLQDGDNVLLELRRESVTTRPVTSPAQPLPASSP